MELYTATEAARALGRSLELIARYCREGRLVGSRRKGRCWLIPVVSLERFRTTLASHRRGRPRRPDPSVFWREAVLPPEEARARLLATRDPTAMPQWVSRQGAAAFAHAGRTRLERRVRKAMVEELYAHRA
ncbi:MAG: helix-turn-helix domain-containing protein [Verrucomicrobiae bacterium]|nr:helix-turn-helix domain-containing protein [Verrucomicrobiae bacterium]